MQNQYKGLIRISVEHAYYAPGNSAELIRIQPDDETARLLSANNCRLQHSDNQITVFGQDGPRPGDLDAVPLRFEFRALDATFFDYTELPERGDGQTLLYSNQDTTSVDEGGQTVHILNMQLSPPVEEDDARQGLRPPLGLIVLDPSNPTMPDGRRLMSASGRLQPQHYTIRFNAISPYWRYILFGLEDEDAYVVDDTHTAFTMPRPIKANGKAAHEIHTLAPIPLRCTGDRPTLHYTTPTGQAVAMSLPRPTTCKIAGPGEKPISEIYVYLS